MKRMMGYAIVIAMGLVVCACASGGSGQSDADLKPAMSVSGTAKLDAKGIIEISGQHFPAGSELALLLTTQDGVQSDIGYALEPVPVPDGRGAWSTRWSYGRYVKKKLVKAGDYTLTAVDQDFNVLSTTTIEFIP